jgi:hypothetical protein
MPSPKATEMVLTEEEQKGLEQLVRRHNIGQHIALRRRIILATSQKKTGVVYKAEIGSTRQIYEKGIVWKTNYSNWK